MAKKTQLPKPQIGATVYLLPLLTGSKQSLSPVVVRKVGRKYFTCRSESDPSWFEGREYDIETWFEKCDPCASRLYPSPQALDDENEARAICRELGDLFYLGSNRHQTDLDTLRKIRAMVAENAALS